MAVVVVLGSLVLPLERTHRRTRHLPRPTDLERRDVPQWW